MANRVVLVTGTSSGFGKLVVPLYLERGWTVVATMRAAKQRAPQLFGAQLSNARLHVLELDVERPEDWQAAARYLEEKLGGQLDVLVNNAGYGLFGTLEDMTLEQLRKQFEVNFFGLAGLTKALLPLLRRSQGRILNLSSISGLISVPMCSAYNAAKFAVEGFTEALYYDLRPMGVQVGLIEPGAYQTDFATRSINLAEGVRDPRSPYHEMNQVLLKVLDIQRGADPLEVAHKIIKLSECRRVPLRTLAGSDAKAGAMLRRLLPHSLRVGLVARFFEQIKKKMKKKIEAVAPVS